MKKLKWVGIIPLVTILLIASTNTSAEVNYNYKDESHREDMICIGAYGVGRGMTQGFDNKTMRELTQLQNNLILKYAYSKQLNAHVETRKMLLKNYGNDYVIKLIKKCKK